MSGSTSLLDLLSTQQPGKETTANDLLNAASPSMLFGRRGGQCTGLVFAYYGGVLLTDGSGYQIANGTITLTASSGNNYVEATRAGVVVKNTTGFTPGNTPLYMLVAGASSITSYVDWRAWVQPRDQTSKASVAVTAADVTLTEYQARCGYLTTTGILTANRNVIVPNDWQAFVFCNNTGAYTTTVKTAAGTGIVVAQGKRSILLADGTNVVRVTADV